MSDYEYPPLRQRVQSLIEQIKSTLLLPFRIATSKLAIRTYLTSLLFFLTSFFLLAIAVAAYTSFYWSYIPRIGFSRQIHLQYDHYPPPLLADSSASQQANPLTHPHPHPWGTVPLAPDFASQQLYDITVHLTLPRTPENTRQGNFMLNAHLLGPTPSPSPSPPGANPLSNLLPGANSDNSPEILASSRRAAYLTYYSREVDLARKAIRLPVLLTGLSLETEEITILLFEGVSFPRGWRNIPSTLKLEVQSREGGLQIYECKVEFRARFRGLRWIMYNHRILSAVVFVCAFWAFEVGAMGVAWLVLSLVVFPSSSSVAGGGKRIKGAEKGERRRIKQEDDDDDAELDEDEENGQGGEGEGMSDTERTFPSYASQPLLRYQKSVKQGEERGIDGKKIKQEDGGEGDGDMEPFPPLLAQQMTGPEAADDEDDDEAEEGDDYVLDSGLGTSLESSAGGRREGGAVRRRKSGRGRVGS